MGPDPPPSLPSPPPFTHIVLCSPSPCYSLHLLFGRTGLPLSETVRWCSCISRRRSSDRAFPSSACVRPLPYFSVPPSPLCTAQRSPFEALRHTSPWTNAKLKRTTLPPSVLCVNMVRELLHGRWTGWAHFFHKLSYSTHLRRFPPPAILCVSPLHASRREWIGLCALRLQPRRGISKAAKAPGTQGLFQFPSPPPPTGEGDATKLWYPLVHLRILQLRPLAPFLLTGEVERILYEPTKRRFRRSRSAFGEQ